MCEINDCASCVSPINYPFVTRKIKEVCMAEDFYIKDNEHDLNRLAHSRSNVARLLSAIALVVGVIALAVAMNAMNISTDALNVANRNFDALQSQGIAK